MLRKITFLFNAALVAGVSAMAVDAYAPQHVSALAQRFLIPALTAVPTTGEQRPATTGKPGTVGTASSRTGLGTNSSPGSALADLRTAAVPRPTLVRTSVLPPSQIASSLVGDAVVAPIVRRRPASGPVISALEQPQAQGQPGAAKTAAADLAARKTAAKNVSSQPAKTAALAPASVKTTPVKTAQATASKKPIDLSGRSALGVAPGSVKCNPGLKFDASLLKCVSVAPKPVAQPKPVKVVPVKIVKVAPIPAAAISDKP